MTTLDQSIVRAMPINSILQTHYELSFLMDSWWDVIVKESGKALCSLYFERVFSKVTKFLSPHGNVELKIILA